MKLLKKSSEPITVLIDAELSKYITEKNIEYRQKHLHTATKLSVLDFKAMPESTRIGSFIGSLVTDYQHLVDHVNTRLSGDIQKLKGQSHISDTEDELSDIQRQVTELDNRLAPLKGKFDDRGKRFKTVVRRWNWLFQPVLIFISSMELIANFDALSTLGGSKISSLGIAILTGISIYWYAHFTPEKIKRYAKDNIKKQVLLFLIFLIPIVAIFYIFSSMRMQYMQALHPELEGAFNGNPMVFTIINAFAYTISCWIIWAYKPNRDVILEYKRYQSDLREMSILEKEKEMLLQRQALLQPNLRGKLTDRFHVLLLGRQKEDEILTCMRGCFEEFKMELFLKTNGACAMLFSGHIENDLPPLKFNYQDINATFNP